VQKFASRGRIYPSNLKNMRLTCFEFHQGLLEGMMTSTTSGAEAIAAAERNADLLTARAASGDPSAIPSICRISAATQYSSGKFETSLIAPFNFHSLDLFLKFVY
jgi:hypothetical protein